MYRFKLKEIEVGDTDTKGGKKSTVTDVNPETGAITWDIKDVADFTSTYKELEKAKDFLSKLEKTGKSKDDPAIDKLAAEIQELFNTFRSHIRKNYPEEYERVLRLKEDLSIKGKKVKRINKNNSNNPEDSTVEYEDGTSEPYVDTLEENEGKVDWDNIAKDVADKLKGGYWPWAIKKGVKNITPEDIGSVLIAGGYTTNSGIEKNIGGIMDKVLALVKESVNEQSEQWTQLDVININKSLRLALKTFNNLVRNLKRLEGELGKHSNKPQGNLLQGMAPDSFDYMGVQNKLNKLYNAFSNAFSIDESVNESVNYRDMAVKSANAWDGGEFLKYINDLNKKNVKIPKKYMKDLLDTIKYANKHKDEKGSDYHQTEAINDFYDTLEILFKNGILTGKELNESVNEDALQGPETKDVYKVGDTIIYRDGNKAKSGTIEHRSQDRGINSLKYYIKSDSDGKGYFVKHDNVVGINLEEESSTSQGGASFTPGSGAQYATPYAFKKKNKSNKSNNIYKYKLSSPFNKPVPKKIKGSGLEVKQLFEKEELTEYSDFQQKRINVFNEVEEKLNSLGPLLSNAKNATAEYYNENPGAYTIIYSTDMINELLDDIKELLKQTE